jgi:hypothetical protein
MEGIMVGSPHTLFEAYAIQGYQLQEPHGFTMSNLLFVVADMPKRTHMAWYAFGSKLLDVPAKYFTRATLERVVKGGSVAVERIKRTHFGEDSDFPRQFSTHRPHTVDGLATTQATLWEAKISPIKTLAGAPNRIEIALSLFINPDNFFLTLGFRNLERPHGKLGPQPGFVQLLEVEAFRDADLLKRGERFENSYLSAT